MIADFIDKNVICMQSNPVNPVILSKK